MIPVIKSIYVYPIKGVSGVELNQSYLQKVGLVDDRRFMLVNQKNEFISQRSHKTLSQIKVDISNDANWTIHFGNNKIQFDKNTRLSDSFKCQIWEHSVECVEISKELNSWFSDLLHEEIKLVAMKQNGSRIKKYSNREGSTPVSFAHGYPILILGTASLDYLNSKLEQSVDANRFRANILVQTEIPHIEDTWTKIEIGDTLLEVIKPCARCQVVNIDQESGVSSTEPIKTISTYRKIENKIYFGANASCIKEGTLESSDQVNLKN